MLHHVAIVAYLTHPLGESDTAETLKLTGADKMAGALDWFRFLLMTTRWVIQAPWFVYVVAVPDAFARPRPTSDRKEMLLRSDLLIMVGGRPGPNMDTDRRHAAHRAYPMPVVDLLDMGDTPPWSELDKSRREILERARAAGL